MALVLNDRVKETTTTNGTNDFALSGAESGFQSFADGIGANNTTYYSVTDNTDWEVGLGTLSANGLTLARTTVLRSSNNDNKVGFSAGSKTVFVTYPADKAVLVGGNVSDLTNDAGYVTGTFPFYKSDATLDTIGLVFGAFPFFDSSGASKNITLTT